MLSETASTWPSTLTVVDTTTWKKKTKGKTENTLHVLTSLDTASRPSFEPKHHGQSLFALNEVSDNYEYIFVDVANTGDF